MARRVVTRLSDEQYAILLKVRIEMGWDEATAVRNALRLLASQNEGLYGRWPDNDPKWGGLRNSDKVKK